jgi:hypothetical protein
MVRKEKNGGGKNISTCWQSEFVLFAFPRTAYYYPVRSLKMKNPVMEKGVTGHHESIAFIPG